MLKVEVNKKFDEFLLFLEKADLISLETENRLVIKDWDRFLEFGFGIYLLWIHIHKRRKFPFLYFTEIDSEHTLFLVSPP